MSEYLHNSENCCNGPTDFMRGNFYCRGCHRIVPKNEVQPCQVAEVRPKQVNSTAEERSSHG